VTDDTPIPIGLLKRLAAGDSSREELDLVETWVNTEGATQPPADVLRRAWQIARDARPSPLLRLVATLVHDSGLSTVLAGTRGTGRPRHLTYVVNDVQLELELSGSHPRAQTLVGQIIGGGHWLIAEVENSQGEHADADVDDVGMFAFLPIAQPRSIVLRGRTAELHVSLPIQGDGGI
jgi:hypothetical protein